MAEVGLSTKRVSQSVKLTAGRSITCRPAPESWRWTLVDDGTGRQSACKWWPDSRSGPTCEKLNRGGDMVRQYLTIIHQSNVINEANRERWTIDVLISPLS